MSEGEVIKYSVIEGEEMKYSLIEGEEIKYYSVIEGEVGFLITIVALLGCFTIGFIATFIFCYPFSRFLVCWNI